VYAIILNDLLLIFVVVPIVFAKSGIGGVTVVTILGLIGSLLLDIVGLKYGGLAEVENTKNLYCFKNSIYLFI
jgi:hypothetical protein